MSVKTRRAPRRARPRRAWVGFDVGGTFIDLVLLEHGTGRLHCWKVPGGGDAASQAAAGLAELMERTGTLPGAIGRVVHGTTLATNLIVERKAAPVGLITTAGFRDIIEIGRMKRTSLYDIFVETVAPLAPRPLRAEVRERLGADGASSRRRGRTKWSRSGSAWWAGALRRWPSGS